MPRSDDPATSCRDRHERFRAEHDRLARHSSRLANARLAVFLGAAAGLAWIVVTRGAGVPAAATTAALVVAFIALAIRHDRVIRTVAWLGALAEVSQRSLRRLHREWHDLPLPATDIPPNHPYAADLDLAGRASVLQLLGGATPQGRACLARWLLHPAPPDTVRARQQAVAELAPRIGFRDALAAHGHLLGRSEQATVSRFLEWAEDRPWLLARPWLRWVARILPAAMIGLAAAQLAGLTQHHLWFPPFVGIVALTAAVRRTMSRIYDRASHGDVAFHRYAEMFALITAARCDAPALRHIQETLTAEGVPADRQLRRLDRIAALADVRRSALAHFPLQMLTLWDLHVVAALERWQVTAGPHVRQWLEALGELDALSALAALAHAHPAWCFPEIAEQDDPVLEATSLGHPLLPIDACVGNDVTVGPPGTFLLVTGSNMSGKSTLLRAIGVNVVLAQAGGPVRARAMRLPAVALFTGMRVQDSLEQGVSQYMAEVLRLKALVETAESGSDRPTLYLLDEALQGTNIAERRIAVRRVLLRLLGTGAIGTVTTHDLALAEEPLAAAAQPVHFQETVTAGDGGPRLSFDYVLRPGLATTTNALALMDLVGLGDEAPVTAPAPRLSPSSARSSSRDSPSQT